MYRVGRVWYDDHIAWCGDRLGHVGKAFLGPQRGNDLGLGIELDAKAALVIGRLGPAQARNALGSRIAIGARLADRLNQLVDDVLGRWQVGIAHAQIDDVGSAGARLAFQAVDLGEYVRRQALDAVEVLDHDRSLGCRFSFFNHDVSLFPEASACP